MAPSCVRIAAIVAFLGLTAHALQIYQQRLPNGNKVQRNGGAWYAVGHNTSFGGSLNPFAIAFIGAGRQWTTALCQADADGDGFTNGQELGDADCTWNVNATPARVTGISHPGYADSTPNLTSSVSTTTTAPKSTSASVPPRAAVYAAAAVGLVLAMLL